MATIEEIIVRLRVEAGKSLKQLQQIGQQFKKNGEMTKKAKGHLDDFNASSSKAAGLAKRNIAPFQGWAMSLMFAGMALQRVFTSVWKSSTKMFQDVSHSIEGASTGFDKLQGATAFLKFLVGEAFEPIATWLIPIVDKLSDWISKNQKLVAGVLVVIGVLGTFLMILGMATLAISNGLIPAWTLLTSSMAGGAGFWAGLASISLATFALITLALLVFIAMWKTNFGGIKDVVKEIFNSIGNIIGSALTMIKEVFSGLLLFLEGIFTGDWDKVWQGLLQVMFAVAKHMVTIMANVFAIIYNISTFVVNGIVTLFFGMITRIVGAVRSLIDLTNKLREKLGLDKISTSGLDKIIDDVNSMKETIKIDTVSGDFIKSKFDSPLTNMEELINGVKKEEDDFSVGQSVGVKQPVIINNYLDSDLIGQSILEDVNNNIN